jgi:farnesyl diphosphate synthase
MTNDAKRAKTQAAEDQKKFEAEWTQLAKSLADTLASLDIPEDARAYLSRMLEYTCVGGKMNRGLAVVATLRTLVSGRELTSEELQSAIVAGWCIEILQAFFLVADDLMDSSLTRRGQPCWYRNAGVGTAAVNDSFILESSLYILLKQFIKGKPYYVDLMELFQDVTYKTEVGQLLDLTTVPPGTTSEAIDWSRFTIERYRRIVKYKTAYYSFYLPVAVGLYIAQQATPEVMKVSEQILCVMGEFFQIQDDYLDCYGSPEVIGKIGTDIQDAKCSWLIVQALGKATPEQVSILKANYGVHDMEKVERVKQVYVELGLEPLYKEYEERTYKELCSMIDSVQGVPHEAYYFLLHKIYKREK